MYSPKIKADLVPLLREIGAVERKPITALVDEMLRPQVTRRHEQVVSKGIYAVQLNLFSVAEYQPKERVTITSPYDVWALCKEMKALMQERLDVLLLDTKNGVMRRQTVFLGSLNVSVFHPREIYALAIEHRAASVIVVHNHPSGDSTPSREDIQATRQLVEAGNCIQIPVLDHLIIGNGFTSLKDKGYI